MSRWRQPYFLYLLLVSAIGAGLVIWSVTRIATFEPLSHFLLLLSLAVIGQLMTTSVAVSTKAGITYQVTPAVALAAVPFFGPAAAILVDAISAVTLWLIKPRDETTWKKNWEQLAFNAGMNSVAMFGASLILLAMRDWLGAETFLGATLPWLVAAIVNDQLNLWLLTGILSLQHGGLITPTQIWRQNVWAMPISILLMTLGGGLLAFSLERFGWPGVVTFFIPILLSAYAFRLYVRQMQAHLQKLERMVEDRTAELAASVRRKDALISVLTHDMITPLTSTQLYAELLREDPQVAIENPDLLDIMLHSQKTVLNLVQNILDIERLQENGALPSAKERFDLGEAIAYTVGMLRAQAREKDIRLDYQLEKESMPFLGDQQQIERVLLNLLTNAVKFTPAGGAVNIRAHYHNGTVIVDVTDTGPGLPTGRLESVLERYDKIGQRGDSIEGSGLGLAISKALIENHSGQITVKSQPGVGSTFTVSLPQTSSSLEQG